MEKLLDENDTPRHNYSQEELVGLLARKFAELKDR
jgi:hypothetical protein